MSPKGASWFAPYILCLAKRYNPDPCLHPQIPAKCRSETMHLLTSCSHRGCHNHSHLQTKTTQLIVFLSFWYTSSFLRTGHPSERRSTCSGQLPTRVVRVSSAVRLLSPVALFHRTVVSWHLNISQQRFSTPAIHRVV